jgi:hypothetical protein
MKKFIGYLLKESRGQKCRQRRAPQPCQRQGHLLLAIVR